MVEKTVLQMPVKAERNNFRFAPGFFEEKNRSNKTQNNQHLKERTPTAPKQTI
jgi:hypothetical protein